MPDPITLRSLAIERKLSIERKYVLRIEDMKGHVYSGEFDANLHTFTRAVEGAMAYFGLAHGIIEWNEKFGCFMPSQKKKDGAL